MPTVRWSLTACSQRPALIDALRRHASPTRARSRVQQTDRCDDAGVCREWRCKYEGDKATSASLEACSKVLDEYLPELKKIDGVTVNRAVQCAKLLRSLDGVTCGDGRGATPGESTSTPSKRCRRRDAHRSKTRAGLVCGGCLDFKVMVTQPLEGYGPWEEAGHPPEADFIAKLKAIPGVSQVETQTITNMVL